MGVHHFWPTHARPEAAGPQAGEAVAAAVEPSLAVIAAPVPVPVPARVVTPAPRPAARGVDPPAPQSVRLVPEGVDQMDWPALQEAVAACRACALCEGRRQPVFGTGHLQARWMLVGEVPSDIDEQQGEPFADRSGQLLDRMLDASGLTRQDAPAEQQVYLANVIKCRPPEGRAPQTEEAAQCESFLRRQVELVRPKVIVVMGRFAVQSLLKTSEAIGRLRGRTHEWHGVPLVVTFHPSYLLRNPADKALAWDDLCRARALVQSSM